MNALSLDSDVVTIETLERLRAVLVERHREQITSLDRLIASMRSADQMDDRYLVGSNAQRIGRALVDAGRALTVAEIARLTALPEGSVRFVVYASPQRGLFEQFRDGRVVLWRLRPGAACKTEFAPVRGEGYLV